MLSDDRVVDHTPEQKSIHRPGMIFGTTLRFLYGNYNSFHIEMTSGNKAAGLSSVRPTQLIQHSGPSEKIGLRRRSRRRHEEREEKRRAWPLSGVRSRFLRTSRIVDESFMGHAWRYYSPLSRTPRTTTHGQLNVTPYNNGAACLSVLFPPLFYDPRARWGTSW